MKKSNFFVALVALVAMGVIVASCSKEDETESNSLVAKTVVLTDPQAVVGQWQIVSDGACCDNVAEDLAMYCNGNGNHWGNGEGNCDGEGNGHHWGDGNCDSNGHHWGNGDCDGEGCDSTGHHWGDGDCDGNGHCGEGCDTSAVRNQFVGTIWDIVTDGTIVMNNMVNGVATTVENGTWIVDNDCLVIDGRRFVVMRLDEAYMVLREELVDGSRYHYRFVKE